jgi:hypothetical protein
MPLMPKFPPDDDIAGKPELLYNISGDGISPAEIKKKSQDLGNRRAVLRILA